MDAMAKEVGINLDLSGGEDDSPLRGQDHQEASYGSTWSYRMSTEEDLELALLVGEWGSED